MKKSTHSLPALITRVVQRSGRDCLRCCAAMVTAQPYEAVPDFVSISPKSWSADLKRWLHTHGRTFLRLGSEIDFVPRGAPVIAIGLTASGTFHAIVDADGYIDPDPAERGLVADPKHRLVILPLAREL